MQISQLSDDQLLISTKSWALREQECSIELLKHLVEVHHRNLWAERGYSSVWEYIRSLGYTENQAYERAGALKFILRNLEAKKAVETGKINLSQAAATERVLRKEEKETKTKVQPEVVETLISQVEGRSKRDTEKALLAFHPEEVPKERLKQVTETLSQANFAIDEETRRNLEKYWNGRGKTTLSEVFSECLRFFVERKIEVKPKIERMKQRAKEKKVMITPPLPEKLRGLKGESVNLQPKSLKPKGDQVGSIPSVKSSPTLPPNSRKISAERNKTRYIPALIRRQARDSAQNQCEYTDERTGRRCESRHLLQFDHIYPFTFGGSSEAGNIRVLCAIHNRYIWKRLLPSGHRELNTSPTQK